MDASEPNRTGRRARVVGLVLAGLWLAGVGALQRDRWVRGEPVDLLALDAVRIGAASAAVERSPGRLSIRGDSADCAEGARGCPELVLQWSVPVDTRFAEIRARGHGDAVAARARWVRVYGLHGGTALAGALPASGRSVVPAGRDPVRVQVRYREASGLLSIDRLEVAPVTEHPVARAARAIVWTGWLCAGLVVASALARSVPARPGALVGAVCVAVWAGLSLPSFEWMEIELARGRVARPATVELPVVPAVTGPGGLVPVDGDPSPGVEPASGGALAFAPSLDDLVPALDAYTGMHLFGFAALGGVVAWTGARPRWAVIALAPMSEVAQSVMPGRTARLDDLVVDLSGLALGMGVAGCARWLVGRGAER